MRKKVFYEGLYSAPPVIGFTTPVVEGKVIGILCKCLAVKKQLIQLQSYLNLNQHLHLYTKYHQRILLT